MKRAKKLLAIMLAAVMVSSTIDYSGMMVVNAEETDVVAETVAESEAVTSIEAAADTEEVTDTETVAEPEITAENETATDTEVEVISEPDLVTDTEVETVSEIETVTDTEGEAVAQSVTGTENEIKTQAEDSADPVTIEGTGTKADPYIVTTGEEFAKYLPKGYVKLNNDITLAGCEAVDVYTSSGIDLNGNVLDFTGIGSTSGFTDAVYAGSKEFSITDSNPNKTHDSQYVASDGTIIKGGIITGYNYDTGNSAVFRVVSRNFTMDGGTFFNNTTSYTGACLTIPIYSSATISNVGFYDNKKDGDPGVCIRVFSSDTGINLNVYNCKFVGNSAQSGTAIYSNAENNFIDSCVIENNDSQYYGAVRIFGEAKTTVIKDTTIINNTSEYSQNGVNAAGLYIGNQSQLTLDGKVNITGNTADEAERNVYSDTPIDLETGFMQASNIGLTRGESLEKDYDETVVNAIGDFADCFTSDVDEAELYIKDGNLNLQKLSHVHNPGTKHETVAATCVADGSKEYYECTVCGKIIDSDGKIIKNIVIPATGIHTSSDWITDKEATTTSEGSKHKECTVCKKVLETGTIPKLEIVDPGKLEKRNTDTLALNNDINSLSSSLLTDQERELVKNGADAVVYAKLGTEVDKANLEKVNAALGTLTLGKAYDISLWVQVGDNAARQITSTSEKINLSLKVDDSLINKNSNIKRTYKVIRIHDGVAAVLEGSFDAATQMFTFETDQFSTYALVYVDTAVSQEPSVTPPSTTPAPAAPAAPAATPQPASASSTQSVTSPKTGDTSPSLWMFAIIIIAGVGIAGYGLKRKTYK